VKDGPGLRPVAQTAKRHFLNRLETSSKPWLCLPTFILHSSGLLLLLLLLRFLLLLVASWLLVSCFLLLVSYFLLRFLNYLETSFKPCFFLPWLCLPTFILHSSGPRTPSQGQNTMAVQTLNFACPPALLLCQLSSRFWLLLFFLLVQFSFFAPCC